MNRRIDRKELLFVPLGGSGEIGMNLNLYHYDGKWLMVDLGVTFGDDSVPGVDLIMPDPAFIAERRAHLLGIVLTHAHEDHLGAVPHLWGQLGCPVYASPFAAAILRSKLHDLGLSHVVPVHEVKPGGRIELGPFDVTFLPITHSIPEAHALAIRTPAGNILHTGDWKLDPEPLLGDPTDRDAFTAFGREGVLAIVCDSTNVFEPGRSGSEGDLERSLTDLVKDRPGRVAVTTFASHLARVKTIARIGAACGREVALVGRSLWRTVEAGTALGYLEGAPRFLTPAEAGYIPPERLLLICTGCQGESRAAMARIAFGNHPDVVLERGDTAIFSSRVIPGNERTIAAVQNRLVADGVEVIGTHDAFVHVSGHPNRDELADMYGWIRPSIAIPVHGETRHLVEHARLAQSLQVGQSIAPANGMMIRLAPGRAEVVDFVPSGRLYNDGGRIVARESDVVRDRQRLGRAGLVHVAVVLDGAASRLAAEPRVSAPGLFERGGADERALAAAAHDAVAALPTLSRRNDRDVEEAVRRALRRVLRSKTTHRPALAVDILRLTRGAAAATTTTEPEAV